jgi:hypothetical protein
MPKKPFKLRFRIPPYKPPRNDWRRQIYQRAVERAKGRVEYERGTAFLEPPKQSRGEGHVTITRYRSGSGKARALPRVRPAIMLPRM